MENNIEIKKTVWVSAKNILRMISTILIILVFCPSFLVSCSGQKINVSVINAVSGIKAMGDYISDPHPIMLVCLALPIVMLAMLFVKKVAEKNVTIIVLVSSCIDLIVWFIFCASVKKFAEDNYCSFKVKGGFVINIIALLVIVAITILVILQKISLDSDLVELLTGDGTKKALNQMTNAVNQMSTAVTQMADSVISNINDKSGKTPIIGYCQKCGKGIPYDCKFCTSCGIPVPESLIKEAEEKRKAEEEARRAEEEANRKAEEEARQAEEEANRKAEEEARIAAEEEARRKAEEENIKAKEIQIEEKSLNVGTAHFCQNCGAKLSENAQFCVVCGTKII